MKLFLKTSLAIILLAGIALATSPQQILPKTFAGWTQTGDVTTNIKSDQAYPAYPAVLHEYGYIDSETATYTRPDGRKLTVRATQFKDATGAYGAFTFY